MTDQYDCLTCGYFPRFCLLLRGRRPLRQCTARLEAARSLTTNATTPMPQHAFLLRVFQVLLLRLNMSRLQVLTGNLEFVFEYSKLCYSLQLFEYRRLSLRSFQ